MKSLTNFEQFNEGASKKKVDANVIADRMMDANLGGHYLLRRYAEEVRALKRVSEYDVDQIIPDHLPGHLIYGLFKESLNEAKDVGHYERVGNQTIVDSNFINYSKGVLPNSELVHLGMGDFAIKSQAGTIEFARSGKLVGIGQDFVGRPHRMTDDKNGKLVDEFLKLMLKKKKAILSMSESIVNEAKEIELGGIKAERLTAAGIKGWKITVDSAKGRGTQVIMIPDSIGKELFQFLHKNT